MNVNNNNNKRKEDNLMVNYVLFVLIINLNKFYHVLIHIVKNVFKLM